jgi:hypothetical protein
VLGQLSNTQGKSTPDHQGRGGNPRQLMFISSGFFIKKAKTPLIYDLNWSISGEICATADK